MNEEFLNYLWRYQLLTPNLESTDGEEVSIISPGTRNTDSGPDFFNAMITIGSTQWAGNVEIHVNSSDWIKHKHHNNEVYNNVILHVVFVDDKPIYRKNGELIPTLELKNKFEIKLLENYKMFQCSLNGIPCYTQIHSINHFEKLFWFDRLMVERLEYKSEEILAQLNVLNNDFSQVFYELLAKGIGYTANADAMAMLASSLPLKLLLKHKDNLQQIEALLFGQSGLLDRDQKDKYPIELKKEYEFLKIKYNLQPMKYSNWKFMRMRPVSFPTIRISQFANIIYKSSALLSKILESDKLQDVISLLSTSASPYWDNHFRFNTIAPGKSKKLGLATINIILINTIIPTLFVYGKLKNKYELQERALAWLTEIKSETNSIVREFKSIGVPSENAMQSQALIQLKKKYCLKKHCLNCRFGHILLNMK